MNYKKLGKEELIKLVEEKEEKINQLMRYANKDELTDVLNRRAGISQLSRKLEEMKNMKKNLVVTFIDVDGLKYINDDFGHIEGDKLLKIVCNIIKENIRKDDILFRYGGDEFIVAFCNIDLEHAKKIIERVDEKILELYVNDTYKKNIRISSGFSQVLGKDSVFIEELIKEADKAMYGNKIEHYEKI